MQISHPQVITPPIIHAESLTELLFSVIDKSYDQKEIELALAEYMRRTGKGYFDGAIEEVTTNL